MAIFTYEDIKIDTDELTADDMPTEVFKEIFDLCGAEVAVSLLINMQGNPITIPTNGMKKIIQKIIAKRYDGTTASIRQMTRDFKVSESYIRYILNEVKIKPPAPNQLGLFDN